MNIPRLINKHEDERRTLIEWHSGAPMKRCKIIEVKGYAVLGQHYHLKSDSVFHVYKGKGTYELKEPGFHGKIKGKGWMFEGESLFVPRGMVHTLEMYPGSILLEAASEIYDKEDEIQDIE